MYLNNVLIYISLILLGRYFCSKTFVVVQLLSHIQLFVTPWIEALEASLSFTISWSLLTLMSIESVMLFNRLILCCPLLEHFAFNLSQHHIFFQWVGSLTSGGQSIGVSASASVLPMNIQGSSPVGLTGLISLQSKGLSRVFSSTTIQKHQYPLYTYPKCFFCFPNQWSRSPSHNSVQLTLCMQASHS